jgi:hypothetical protein
MLFKETIAAYLEDHTKQIHSVGRMQSYGILKEAELVSTTELYFEAEALLNNI